MIVLGSASRLDGSVLMNTREKREEEWDEKYDGRCPIYQDEEPWVYETEKGWADNLNVPTRSS